MSHIFFTDNSFDHHATGKIKGIGEGKKEKGGRRFQLMNEEKKKTETIRRGKFLV